MNVSLNIKSTPNLGLLLLLVMDFKTDEFSETFQTAFYPHPLLIFGKSCCKKPCLNFQNLLHKFLDFKWPGSYWCNSKVKHRIMKTFSLLPPSFHTNIKWKQGDPILSQIRQETSWLCIPYSSSNLIHQTPPETPKKMWLADPINSPAPGNVSHLHPSMTTWK